MINIQTISSEDFESLECIIREKTSVGVSRFSTFKPTEVSPEPIISNKQKRDHSESKRVNSDCLESNCRQPKTISAPNTNPTKNEEKNELSKQIN